MPAGGRTVAVLSHTHSSDPHPKFSCSQFSEHTLDVKQLVSQVRASVGAKPPESAERAPELT